MLWFAAASSWHKKNDTVDSPWGVICSNVERKNKFKRFEGAVSKNFIVASHQMAVKHLQEVSSFVDRPGVEVFGFPARGLFLEHKSPHPVKSL